MVSLAFFQRNHPFFCLSRNSIPGAYGKNIQQKKVDGLPMSNLLMGDDMEQRIIKELCQQAGVFLSAEELSSKLGVNQGFFLEKIDKLKEQGYDILVDSGYRYCLQLAENIILPEDIPKNLRSNLIGKELCFFPRLASSNETARDYFIKGLIGEGAVIAAAVQTGGKGRKGRSWESPAGGLWFSVLFRPYLSIEKTALLSLVFAVAVAAAQNSSAFRLSLKTSPAEAIFFSRTASSSFIFSAFFRFSSREARFSF